MWTHTSYVASRQVFEYTIALDGKTLSYREVFAGWKDNHDFREFYIKLLVDIPFTALFWETPPVMHATIDQPYKFVAVDSTRLASSRQNPSAFAVHFRKAIPGSSVVEFHNLSGTSKLIAPVDRGGNRNYAHFAAFIRTAPRETAHEMFRVIASEIETNLDRRPLWISTSGLGVYWTHVRLDRTPKYYSYGPYKIIPGISNVANTGNCRV